MSCAIQDHYWPHKIPGICRSTKYKLADITALSSFGPGRDFLLQDSIIECNTAISERSGMSFSFKTFQNPKKKNTRNVICNRKKSCLI